MASDESQVTRRSSESNTRTFFGIDLSVDSFSPQRSPSTKSTKSSSKSDKSPQKIDSSADSTRNTVKIQDLVTKMHREEKLRDSVAVMLSEMSSGGSSSPQLSQNMKRSNSIIRQLASNMPLLETQQKKKLKDQYDAAEKEIADIQRQSRELGYDEDDEISSGDEEAPSAIGTSMLFQDDYTSADEDLRPSAVPQLEMLSSAASSSADLHSSNSNHSSPSSRAGDSTDLLLMNSSFYGSGNSLNSASSRKPIHPEIASQHVALMLEASDARSPDATVAVEKSSEFIHSVPAVKAELKAHGPWSLACDRIRSFLSVKDPSIRLLGFRVLRLMLVNSASVAYFLHHLYLELHLIQILSKDDHDKNHDLRLAVIQLIRVIINIPGGLVELSQGVYRALVAISEQESDDTRHICIETLAESMVIDAEKVFEAGGAQILLKAMIDMNDDNHNGAHDSAFSLALAMAFIDAADNPQIRLKYLRNGHDLSSSLTNFTDVQLYSFVKPSMELLRTPAAVIEVMMRSWVGLACFDVSSFVECMTMPLDSIQATSSDVIDRVLWVPDLHQKPSRRDSSAANATTLSYQFTAMLLYRLQSEGLQEKLVTLQNEGINEEIRQRAQTIGSKVLTSSSRLISSHAVVQRSMALSSKLSENSTKAPSHSLPTASVALFGTEAKLQATTASWIEKPGLGTFIRFGVSMDDGSFKKLVTATHVLDTKSFRQWNWDASMELVQGPLRSPKRLDELTRGSKFLKRLLSFYRPFKYRFSNLAITKEHLRYVDVGKEMVQSLLETPEGARYSAQNKLFRQIAECLAQLDPLSGIMSSEPLFSVRRFRTTLCCAYAESIGVSSRSAAGQQILAQIRIFNMLYRVCDINREDVMRSFVCALDYKLEGHPRLILAKALSASARSTRSFATEFVGVRMATREPALWAVDLMIEQLYDTEPPIARAAAVSLHNMCALSEVASDYLIANRPFIDHVSDVAEQLRILFMSRPKGFELLQTELESRHMDESAPSFRESYVDQIEAYLESINTSPSKKTTADQTNQPFQFPTYARPSSKNQNQNQDIRAPSHFYGELASTDQGCRFLESKGMISESRHIIADAVIVCDKDWTLQELRRLHGALWAVGHVASRSKGALLLTVDDAMNICESCKSAQIFTLRGTAFYSLGLFASSLSGAELLHQCNWDVVYDVFGQPMGVASPPHSFYDAIKPSSSTIKRYDSSFTTDFSTAQDSDLQREASISTILEKRSLRSPVKSPSKMVTVTKQRSAVSPTRSHSKSPRPREFSTTIEHTDEDAKDGAHTESMLESNDRRPSVILAPSMSSHSSVSPKSSRSNHAFDFETDPALSSNRSSCFDLLEFPSKRDETVDMILQAIGQLGSSILSQNATKRLVAMRASHPTAFQRDDLTREVMHLISSGHYKQMTRRFIFELLDIHAVIERFYRKDRLN